MDTIGWFIATIHQMFGHVKAAAFLGMPSGDIEKCILCRYQRSPTPENKQAVIDAIGHG